MHEHELTDRLSDSLPALIKSAPSYWENVRMKSVNASIDPDDNQRIAVIPGVWNDDAALGLLDLCSSDAEIVRFSKESLTWLDALTAYAKEQNETPARALSNALACMLITQEAAPTKHFWAPATQSTADKGFTVKLSAFVENGVFDTDRFVERLVVIVRALRRFAAHDILSKQMGLFDALNPQGANDDNRSSGCIWLTDLDATLSRLCINYDSEDARIFARAVSALTRLAGCVESSSLPPLPFPADAPESFQKTVKKILKDRKGAHTEDNAPITCGWSSPNVGENLLGVETCGFAPAYSPLTVDGHLRPSILARLEQEGISVEYALALAIAGESPIETPTFAACKEMYDAVKDYVDYMPVLPDLSKQQQVALARGMKRPLPQRTNGFSQKASISGRDLFMRAHEFEDGTLGEIELIPLKEAPLAKSLMHCFSQAVSLGLQYGAPLEAFIDKFAYSQFGPSGLVDGDRNIQFATSMLDYAFRSLSEAYLGKTIPDAPQVPGVFNIDAHKDKAPSEPDLFNSKDAKAS